MLFVSGNLNLTFPIQMVHDPYTTSPTQCTEALDAINKSSGSQLMNVIVKGLGDSILLDLRNTSIVGFNNYNSNINIPSMIMLFFLLSWAFQIYNGAYLEASPSGPHHIQYIEYSFSSSLTIVIMALNTGIVDLFTILSILTLFFGMNVFGVVAECMMHLAETWGPKARRLVLIDPITFANAWTIPHFCGWVLFFFAWTPIVVKYHKIQGCSENHNGSGVPWFIAMAVIVESFLYFLFGILQLYVLIGRTRDLGKSPAAWKRYLDVGTILLSLLAKTFLAWALLGPAYTANF